MNTDKNYLLLSFVLLVLFIVNNANAQVQLLWTSPASTNAGVISNTNLSMTRQYFYIIDTSAHQCKLYNADNFALAYTITGLSANDYPYYLLDDMNGNGSPEVFFANYTVGARIIDASTSKVIYSWPANYAYYGYFITPSSNTLKIAFRNSSNSLVVYSLGITIASSVSQQSNAGFLPSHLTLQQNFPNPFNPSTTIEYSMPHADNVSIEIFDITGKLIKTLISERQDAGEHFTLWDGSDSAGSRVSSGTYFYLLKYGNSQAARKMILLK
jgi:hypothetical protein